MKISVDKATEEEKKHHEVDEMVNLRMPVHEVQIFRTMLGAFRNDINLLKEWIEELEDAGVVAPEDLYVAALTTKPILFFSQD